MMFPTWATDARYATTEAEAAKEKAIGRVEDHATEGERLRLRRAVHWAAQHSDKITADSVWEVLGDWRPREPRLLGAILRTEAAILGFRPDGWMKSDRVECHRRPVQVWRRG